MTLSDRRIIVISVVGIFIASLITVLITPDEPQLGIDHPYSGGISSLLLWLEESGYDVDRGVESDLSGLDMLFLINPYLIDHDELRSWVRKGGTLILAGGTPPIKEMLNEYGMTLQRADSSEVLQSGPTLITPPVGSLRLDDAYGLGDLDNAQTMPVIHATIDQVPVIASWADGRGQVWFIGSIYPFTNSGLRENARLILNLLIPPPSKLGFSEGMVETGPTLFDWFTTSAPGWAILSGIAITYVYLTLRGRRFGVAVPLPEDRLRREPLEYIQAMANLYRYSGERGETLKHYERQVRRRLIQRYGLDATLSDAAMIDIITRRDPSIDGAALKNLLEVLKRRKLSETELVRAAQMADRWLNDLERHS